MENIDILDKLYSGLKFKDAVYSERTNICTLNFLYNPEIFKITDEVNINIYNKVKELIGDYVKYEINFIKCPLDKSAIANHTYLTIMNSFPAISRNFNFDDVSVEIDNVKVKVTLKLSPTNYDYATGLNRESMVAEKLKESFLADFEVEFKKKEEIETTGSAIENNIEFLESVKTAEEKVVYELSDITNIIGKNDYSLALDYTKIKSPVENVIICGEITNVQKRTYTKKLNQKGESKEVERVFYSFSIKNENRFMYCSIFPKQSDENKCELLEVGMKICTFGSFRSFNGKLNFTSQTIARCEYKKEEIKSKTKVVNEEYHVVKPEKYIHYEQSGLFDEVDKKIPGTYVVFDLETTGLESNKDEIIEIGACKIVDGRIDETFSTFVKPSKHIPREITEITGITDEMVSEAPAINYVLPDFYKFCYGAIMVGHNVSFDIGFIYAAGKKHAYEFDNKLMDTMEMARNKLPGLKNYKLKTIVEKLGIVLKDAHRAINDATATAKVFLKLL